MLINRTTGSASVVPELVYDDVEQAIGWLCETFGFTELWRAGRHRARLEFGNGVIIIADDDPLHGRSAPKRSESHNHAVMVRVDDVDAHHERAREHGAVILSPPADYSYGERPVLGRGSGRAPLDLHPGDRRSGSRGLGRDVSGSAE